MFKTNKKGLRFRGPCCSCKPVLLIAAVPVLVVVRVALVGVVVVVGVDAHGGGPFYFGGLGLDVPGEGMVAAGMRTIDQRGWGLRSAGLHGGEFSGRARR
jgi:hypothetical protein